MSQSTKGPHVRVEVEIIQIKQGQKYKGRIQIGDLRVNYCFESVFPIKEIKEKELRSLKIPVQKILFLIKVTSCEGAVFKQDKELIFFHDILYPNIKRSCYELEMVLFNQMNQIGRKACIRARENSIGRPVKMIIIPHKIYRFEIKKRDIPKSILMFV